MASLFLANPRKRRKSKAKRKAPKRAKRLSSTTVARRVVKTKRYRRNPISGGSLTSKKGLMQVAQDGAIGAGGAFAVDVLMNYFPQLKTMGGANFQPLVNGALGIALGVAVSKVGKTAKMKKIGVSLAEGALTVQLHEFMKANIGPSVGLAGYDNLLGGLSGNGLLGLSAYTSSYPQSKSLGAYTNAAPIADGMPAFMGGRH